MSTVAVPTTRAATRVVNPGYLGGLARNLVWGLSFPLIAFVGWEGLAMSGQLDPVLFSRPSAIFAAGWREATSGALWRNLAVSVGEVVAGFALAVAIGLVIGFAMGSWRRIDYVLEPVVIGLYSAPIVALYPLLILWFGLGFTAMLTLVVLFAVFPVIVNTALGVRLTDPVLIRTARSFGASPREIALRVILPAAIPSILAGLRLTLGRALIGVVVAELFMGSAGIGFAIGYAAGALRTADVFFGIFVVGTLGVGLNSLMSALEHRLLRGSG
jgi:ABC-type nitrate/sulfonate/bicarbonate transport system permease component